MKRYGFNGTPILTNSFRDSKYAPHLGEDFALAFRTAIIAKADGEIVTAKGDETRQWLANTPSDPYRSKGFPLVKRSLRTEDYGNYIKIFHGKDKNGNKIHTLYAHLDEVVVYNGQFVVEGELIGYADSKGNSTGNHVHEETRINDRVVNPNTFDYSFNGKGGVNEPVHAWQGTVMITVPKLYVRKAPARTYALSGSREVHKGNQIKVTGYVEGENIDNNSIWFKSQFGNYFWSGGTDKPSFKLPQADNEKKNKMTQEEKQLKQEEFEGKKAHLESKQRDLDAKNDELEREYEALEVELDTYKKEYEAFIADSTQVEEAVEEVVEEEVEDDVEEEEVEESVEEPVVDEEAKEELKKHFAIIDELKTKLGL